MRCRAAAVLWLGGGGWAIAASAAAFGPVLAGYLYDVTGSYGGAFALSAALNLAAACLVLFLRRPSIPERTAPSVAPPNRPPASE